VDAPVSLYRIYGVSDDYVVISDGAIKRKYPFDFNSEGVISVRFADDRVAVLLEWSFQWVDEAEHYLWAVQVTEFTRGQVATMPSRQGESGEPEVHVECENPPRITTGPAGNSWTFPEGEQ